MALNVYPVRFHSIKIQLDVFRYTLILPFPKFLNTIDVTFFLFFFYHSYLFLRLSN